MLMLCLFMLETQEDKDTFTVLYDAYRQDMQKKAYYILKDSQLAEDVVQEAFLSIAKNFDKIKCKEKCIQTRNYFVNIVKNKSIDLYRKRIKQNYVSFNQMEAILIDNLSDIDRIIEGKELELCFKLLPEHYQAVLSMKYVYGHNDQEIAILFGMTKNNVKTRSVRAKKKLAQILEESEITV